MDTQLFFERMAEILEVPPGAVSADFRLAEGQWDSVAVMSTIALIDELSGAAVSGEQMNACATVGDLLELAWPS
jgi:acyl carrier protein